MDGDPFDSASEYDPLDPDADCFKPPAIPTEVHCIHCDQEYESYLIEWRVFAEPDGKKHGFWCCPVPGCGGKGFCFDIFPTDPDYVGEDGEKVWHDDEGEEDEESDGDEYEEDLTSEGGLIPPAGAAPEPEVPRPPTGSRKPVDDDDIPW